MNQLTIMGHLGKDAWINQNGDCLQFSIATKENWKDEEGNWQERVDWHLCKVYNKKNASKMEKLKKGKRVLITGKQRNNSFKDENNNWQNISYVSVDNLRIIDRDENIPAFTAEEIPF